MFCLYPCIRIPVPIPICPGYCLEPQNYGPSHPSLERKIVR